MFKYLHNQNHAFSNYKTRECSDRVPFSIYKTTLMVLDLELMLLCHNSKAGFWVDGGPETCRAALSPSLTATAHPMVHGEMLLDSSKVVISFNGQFYCESSSSSRSQRGP